MRVEIPYGDGFLPVDLSRYRSVELVHQRTAVEIPDLEILVHNELSASGFLSKLLKSDSQMNSTVLVLDSPHRLAGIATILRSIIGALSASSIPSESISLLLFVPEYFTHRIQEIIAQLGNPERSGCQIHVHDPANASTTRHIGDCPLNGFPVYINSLYLDAAHRLIVSPVFQSIFTGSSGGYSSLVPGISGAKTAYHVQRLMALHPSDVFNCNEHVCSSIQIAGQMAPAGTAMSIVQDAYGHTAHIGVGEIHSTWLDASNLASGLANAKIERRADVSIVGTGGPNTDITLFEAVESLHAGVASTRTGGTIVLVAECSGGIGPEGFINALTDAESERDIHVKAEMSFEPGMERALLFRRVLDTRKLILCSRLRESLVVERLGCEAVRDPQEGIESALRSYGTSARIAVIKSGAVANPMTG
jgi:nickel-dependent lactate racemase